MNQLKINSDRYENLLLELSKITDINSPYTRRSFSSLYLEGREWLTKKMIDLGLDVHIDHAGNLIGRRQGIIDNNFSPNTITIGSHTDTVPNGGRYDGIAGVIAGLECVATMNDLGIKLNHNLEIIDFLAEEPSEWNISCVGSRGISGFLNSNLFNTKHPNTGELLSDAISRMGGDTKKLEKVNHIKAFFELHIEQGKVLENNKINIGIVNSIVGITRIQVEFSGSSNHAGTTPMNLREDAGLAASKLIVAANEFAKEFSLLENKYFVATAGQLFLSPNASNVVSGNSKIVFDIRSSDKNLLDIYREKLLDEANKIATQDNILLNNFEILTNTTPAYCDENLINILKEISNKNGTSSLIMASGAGHDAAFISYVAPISMIFVPSKEGKSHCPEEYTSKEELAIGTNILFETILKYDLTN